MLKNNILVLKEEIREISEIATKEKGFEKMLSKMRSEWRPLKYFLN